MTIKILIDMNLSPDWIKRFERHQWLAVHWPSIGSPKAPDEVIMRWALAHQKREFCRCLELDCGASGIAISIAAWSLIKLIKLT